MLKYEEGIDFHNYKNESKLPVDPFFGLPGTLQGERTLPQLVVIIHTMPGLIVKVKRLSISQGESLAFKLVISWATSGKRSSPGINHYRRVMNILESLHIEFITSQRSFLHFHT